MTTWTETSKTLTTQGYYLLIDSASHQLLIDTSHFLLLQTESVGAIWTETNKS